MKWFSLSKVLPDLYGLGVYFYVNRPKKEPFAVVIGLWNYHIFIGKHYPSINYIMGF